MTNEDIKETAKVILDVASKGVPDLIEHGPILLVKGKDYENEFLQLLGPGGETTPGGFHRALNVRHARYIALVTQAATRLAYRLLELEEENTALSALSVQVLALQEENAALKETCAENKQDIEVKDGLEPTLNDLIREFERLNFHHVNDTVHRMGISEFSSVYCKAVVKACTELSWARTELNNRPTRERVRQIQEKGRRLWREAAKLELELDIWKERVNREQELTEQFRTKMTISEDLLRKGIKDFQHASDYLGRFDCDKLCDSSVGFHEAECCIGETLDKWIYDAKEILEKK